MNNTHYFHFTLGPVQGFVSQARRTRDFWAGSFILSWLAAVAIKATENQGGIILFPKANKNYMSWIDGQGQGDRPVQGGIPNRFKAAIDPLTFQPEAVIRAVEEAWKALADLVWRHDLGQMSPASETATIWDRQIPAFWDMVWVIAGPQDDSAALDKRKNWRSYCPPNEPGVKCSMMDGWQELSGELSPNRSAMSHFWHAVREGGGSGMKSDLADGEALCAIAFVKRRFSRYFEMLDHTMQQGWQLKGWKVPSAVPSVTYMAAAPWLSALLRKAEVNAELKQSMWAFHDAAFQLTGSHSEWGSNIRCVQAADGNKKWKALDGNVFFDSMLENHRIWDERAGEANRLLVRLKTVRQQAELDPVSPFYAILLMDGDSLGMHMSDMAKQPAITKGVDQFTKGVPDRVQQHNGFLIYAGGDDVLAILPLEDAIPCAIELRQHYLDCFKGSGIPTTLSGAIEFTHIKTPLTKVLKDAHTLLDDVAKDGRGRDALAIRVWKPGGLQLEWAQPWEVVLNPQDGQSYLESIADTFKGSNDEQEQFASKFFYKIRERFDLLNPALDKGQASVLSEPEAISLMAMEYLNSGKSDLSGIQNAQERMEKARDRVYPLLKQCRPVTRQVVSAKVSFKSDPRLEADGALLVRFLARKGVER